MSEAPEVATDTTDPDAIATEAPESPKEASSDDRLADLAKLSGWAPLEEWKGDPKDHLSPTDFIVKAVGEVLPSMRKTLNDSKTEISTLKKTLKEFGEHHSKTEARVRAQTLADLQAQQEQAAEVGDVARVREVTERIKQEVADVSAPKPVEPDAEPEELTAWKAENPWFAKSAPMRGAAIEIVNELIAEGVKSLPKQLAEVDKRIRAEFPHKFENPRRQEPGAVEGGQSRPKPAGKSWSDLSSEQKEMADHFVKTIKGFTREMYVKDIFGAPK